MTEKGAAHCLSALGNETRIRLFRALVRSGRSGLTVGELQRRLEAPASTLAHHIAALVRAELVLQERQGREVVCRAGFDAVASLVGYLTEACCTEERGADVACGRQTAAQPVTKDLRNREFPT